MKRANATEASWKLAGLGAIMLLAGGGCTLALDWEECSAEVACPAGYACRSGECRTDTSAKPRIDVTQSISVNTTWTSDNDYVLKDVIFVAPNATLTIRSGTTIYGEQASALVVRAGGRIDARGTKNEPVVFTSAKPIGERAPADWGGVVLLGKATVNLPDASFEGIEDTALGAYGGTDDGWGCGVMQFTRVEFGGYAILAEAEYNGLTLAGCGSATLIDHVQVHKSGDDGVQILGGTVGVKHLVLTDIVKDGLDWEYGWRGIGQFIVVQQGDDDENAFESASNEDDFEATPRSAPTIFNFTLLGSGQNGGNQRAIYMEAGAGGQFSNGIVIGQSLEAVDIVDAATASLVESDALAFSHTLFFDIGASGTHYFPLASEEAAEENDDGGFDEDSWFRQLDYKNVFGVDPQLADPFGTDVTGWVPAAGSLGGLAKRPPVALDQSGDFMGAFQPGAEPWSLGWTAFPAN